MCPLPLDGFEQGAYVCHAFGPVAEHLISHIEVISAVEPASRDRAARKAKRMWQLRVELLDVKPLVWRRLLVPAGSTLPKLHRVLQIALGWRNSHLHEFRINGTCYTTFDPDWAEDIPHVHERGVVLHKALGPATRCLDYIYDFGDDWHHLVLLEDQYPQVTRTTAAIYCTDGGSACPPEDVGGAPGYVLFLEAIADPRHEGHHEYLDWIGGRFDPERFDRATVNRALAGIKA